MITQLPNEQIVHELQGKTCFACFVYSWLHSLKSWSLLKTRGDSNRGEVLPPLVSKQYEVGAKYDINPNLLLSTALFRIEKANQYSDLATPIPSYVQDGLQVHNGVELVLDRESNRQSDHHGAL